MSVLRPLPPRPSLEFEHKEAKSLLRRLKAGDNEALERAREQHPGIKAPSAIRLADAQLVIAREYGFASWPRLVRYFKDLERQRYCYHGSPPRTRDFYDSWVRALPRDLGARQPWARRALVAYVPRFYGMRIEDVSTASVEEHEARLAVARMYGHASWDALGEYLTRPHIEAIGDVLPRASATIEARDLDALVLLAKEHPELLQPTDDDIIKNATLLSLATHRESVVGKDAIRPIMEWLAAQGLDRQRELNLRLCGMFMDVPRIRRLLDAGADPNWIAANGVPVLEHALIRYWNAEAVDLIASLTKPRKALWIAAGLGDVRGVARFLDSEGKPTAEGRRLRPDFDIVGPAWLSSHPDADDEEILAEAFLIAMVNRRISVLDYMIERGFPINTLVFGSPMLNFAAGNMMTDVVECLMRRGADPDLYGWRPDKSAREIARELFVDNEPTRGNAKLKRIVELLGMDPAAL
jgi:hypothetical protein